MYKQHIIVSGNLIAGFAFIGPFANATGAQVFIDLSKTKLESPFITSLSSPGIQLHAPSLQVAMQAKPAASGYVPATGKLDERVKSLVYKYEHLPGNVLEAESAAPESAEPGEWDYDDLAATKDVPHSSLKHLMRDILAAAKQIDNLGKNLTPAEIYAREQAVKRSIIDDAEDEASELDPT